MDLGRIAEVTRSIATPLDLELALTRTCEAVAAVRADVCCMVHRVVPGGYRLLATAGTVPRGAPRVVHGGATVAAAESPGPILVSDLSRDRRAGADDAWLTDAGLVSYLGVPIGGGAGVVAVLGAACPRSSPLAPDERDAVVYLALHAGIAARNARVFAESERRRRATEAVAELGQTLVESLDLATVGRRIADAVCTLLGAPASALYDVDPVSGDYRLVAVSGGAGPTWTDLLPADTGLIGLAVRNHATVAVPDVLDDARVAYTPSIRARVESNEHQPVLAVPLMVKHEPVGALAVGDRRGRSFDAEQLRLARVFANHAAVALENARLYDEAERRRQEAERARLDAETANRLKDDFLATLSHELRTPLTAMLAWVRLLERGGVKASTTAQALEAIERNVKLQARLIDDLLDISRIASGKLSVAFQIVDLVEVVTTSVDSLRPDAESKGLVLEGIHAADVPTVTGDTERLQQIVRNLVDNAIKFTPSGGRISVRVESRGAEATITVADTGEGLAPEELPYVFDRFRQGDSTITRRHRGLGLGLAIVRDLVELHGGTVSAESDGLGLGSRFTVRLPVTTCPEAGASGRTTEPTATREAAPAHLLDGVRILVVEDEPDSQAVLHTVVEASGAESRVAGSGREALQILASYQPDMLLCDIGLPGEDGYQLMRTLRGRGVVVPAIALSAYASNEDRRQALAAGYQRHLAKPVDPDDLVRAIREVMDAGSAPTSRSSGTPPPTS
jgi:signal transduction histidine kinase/CheY-like chemotaxis protein